MPASGTMNAKTAKHCSNRNQVIAVFTAPMEQSPAHLYKWNNPAVATQIEVNKVRLLNTIITITVIMLASPVTYAQTDKIVVQLTRDNENFGHRKAFFQIDKVLTEIGEDKLDIVVVAYEDGIHALTQNSRTSSLLTKLANRGVAFKACMISMKAWELSEDDFPLEVEFVAAGAPEMIRKQLAGYKYWKP